MKIITNDGGQVVTVELTRRNLEVLLAKLDDPASMRTIGQGVLTGDHPLVWVKAVENDEHYADRAPGAMFMPSTGETL